MRKTKWKIFDSISKFYWIYHKIHNWFIGFYKQKYDYKIFCICDLKTGTTSLFKALKILVFDVFSGDGWEKLCNFLDRPIPNRPFPHKNIGCYNKSNLKRNKK